MSVNTAAATSSPQIVIAPAIKPRPRSVLRYSMKVILSIKQGLLCAAGVATWDAPAYSYFFKFVVNHATLIYRRLRRRERIQCISTGNPNAMNVIRSQYGNLPPSYPIILIPSGRQVPLNSMLLFACRMFSSCAT